MKPLEINQNQNLSKEEKEIFFQQLENNSAFFKEAFETMLTLVVSDPILTYQVADLIESDYRNLYQAIIKKQGQVQKNDLPSCCQPPDN